MLQYVSALHETQESAHYLSQHIDGQMLVLLMPGKASKADNRCLLHR